MQEQMTTYIGTKVISATPMSRGEYNKLRGWETPKDEDPSDQGYLVMYEGSDPNHPDYSSYISWSPKKVFEESYQKSGEVSFGKAMEILKIGGVVKRPNWDHVLRLSTTGTFIFSTKDGAKYIPTQSDMVSTDWIVA